MPWYPQHVRHRHWEVPNLNKIISAAEQGVEETKQLIATTCKAKTLVEPSLGHPEPGAISMSVILQFMVEYCGAEVAA